ncbi:MAG: hypothetical protein KME27_07670 [Lyngbya sp. HA4199-MV5]|jgi:hypothetical protein|nr:hypothetical protein [Lyngbya sp. HA4199-MV5]
MTYQSTDEIEALVKAFEGCTLPRSRWTHAAHLTLALWYLVHYKPSQAIDCMREGIQRYNAAMGIQQTNHGGYHESGYHETITLFWLWIGQWYLAERRMSAFALDGVNQFLQQCSDPQLPFRYYSRDRLMSWEARTDWVEPDLHPLP